VSQTSGFKYAAIEIYKTNILPLWMKNSNIKGTFNFGILTVFFVNCLFSLHYINSW